MNGINITEVENGYHYVATQNLNTWITANLNNQIYFIPTTNMFKIEFNILISNQIGIYITKEGSSYFYEVSYNYNGLNHVKFEYDGTSINFYRNNHLERTTPINFEGNPAGFNITDWQKDMDITITNFRIDEIQ